MKNKILFLSLCLVTSVHAHERKPYLPEKPDPMFILATIYTAEAAFHVEYDRYS